MKHQNLSKTFLMIYEANLKLESQTIKVNVEKGTDLNIGDTIRLHVKDDVPYGFEILSVIEKRQSSLHAFNYITCEAKYLKL